MVAEIREVSPELAERAERELLREVRVAPTLVKYADPNAYEIATRQELQQAAAELMRGAEIAPAPLVDLLDEEPLEVELATTLLYEHCHYSYRQVRQERGKRRAIRGGAKSSSWGCAIAASTMRRCARSLPGSSFASTS